ncbi:glycosyltransferase family 2 protein [Candidatus Nitrosotalea okcheonensis]|uniref:Glycosyltransferase n=1 Tax=Candidatus Nitrosotalea okcheonensis TaxID=1903276 RepID=A0A2H1FHS5_9ARCH|nr:glycosyltransferase family 2 protein [Candidatus Nitrosotalea okcheonensis]SMH72284.1 Glycosyltransferase [Candidatus Nitrosotalea okcheonensis]
MKVIIGLPAFNEEKNIASTIAKLQKFSYTIVVCNDGSSDMTGTIAEKMGALVVNHQKNLGYGAGIRTLFTKAKELDADMLVTFDADGQHRVEDIENIIRPIETGEADIVIGSRFLNKTNDTNVPKYRKIGIKVITNVTNSSMNFKISDSQSGFRAYNKKVLKEVTPSEYGMGVSTEILIKANKSGFRFKEVPITILYEGETSTHNPVSHGVSVILSTMKFISIEHPLKFYGIPGMVFLAIGLFFIVWTIQAFTATRQIITNISLIGIGAIILGTMLTMTAILLYSLVNVVRERHSD